MTVTNPTVDSKEQSGAYETDEDRQETSSQQPNPPTVTSRSNDGSPASQGLKKGLQSIDLDVMFDVLKNRRRRRVLEILHEQEGQTTLSAMAECLAAIENDKPREMLSSQERKRVYIGLYQFHLPRMDRAGVIEFDRNRGTIEACEKLAAYHPYADRARPDPRSAPGLLPSTSVLSGCGLIAALFLIDVPGWITDGVLLVALVIVLLLASAGLVLGRRLDVDRHLIRSPRL